MNLWARSLFLLLFAHPCLAQGLVELVSQNSSGAHANGVSGGSAVSGDGRVLAFTSSAHNLAPGDCPFAYDVFVRDRNAGTTELAAVTWDGSDANQDSRGPSLSGDGRYVAFLSIASNLVPNDSNGSVQDLFVRDRVLGTTTIAALTSAGVQSTGSILKGSVSFDGERVVFESSASDFVPGDTNGVSDVFVRNLHDGVVERVSRRSDGSQTTRSSRDGSTSGEGTFVAFASFEALVPADNDTLEDVYVFDRSTGELILASPTYDGSPSSNESTTPVISLDGRTVVFAANDSLLVPGDTNHWTDVFWRDLVTNTTGRASVTSRGMQLSGYSYYPAVSGDGRTIGFWSVANQVAPGVPDLTVPGTGRVYAHDRLTGATTLVDAAPSGEPGNATCGPGMAFSADGRWVAWGSDSSNLVPNDTVGGDAFVRERASDPPARYCTPKVNSLGCGAVIGWSGIPSVSSGLPFLLTATNVIGGESGFLFYGLTPENIPFQGGRLCVASPLRRTPMRPAGGSSGTCSGVLWFDFNSRMGSLVDVGPPVDATLVAGTVVHVQFWYRDPLDPFGIGLSDAVEFVIRP